MTEEDEDMEATIKRPTTIKQSLEQSLKEMNLIRQGKLPRKTWEEYLKDQKEQGNN